MAMHQQIDVFVASQCLVQSDIAFPMAETHASLFQGFEETSDDGFGRAFDCCLLRLVATFGGGVTLHL
jgi:hypothetical protein